MVNASSGAVEHMNVVQVTNLVSAMKELKEENVWLVGFDGAADIPAFNKTDLDMPIGIVLGSEGEGMRRLVKETCDILLSIPMRGHVASLNVAAAGTIALYSAWQARNWQGWQQV
ncbi:MAG UNVERIFIED_CONTAM: RNA methyltransferase [Anaerolineae bacterium]